MYISQLTTMYIVKLQDVSFPMKKFCVCFLLASSGREMQESQATMLVNNVFLNFNIHPVGMIVVGNIKVYRGIPRNLDIQDTLEKSPSSLLSAFDFHT